MACFEKLPCLYERLAERITRAQKQEGIKGLFAKLRFDDFRQTTVECIGTAPDMETFKRLLETGYGRRNRPVRLIGIGVRMAEEKPILTYSVSVTTVNKMMYPSQLALF
jgi:DNA polymerase-4